MHTDSVLCQSRKIHLSVYSSTSYIFDLNELAHASIPSKNQLATQTKVPIREVMINNLTELEGDDPISWLLTAAAFNFYKRDLVTLLLKECPRKMYEPSSLSFSKQKWAWKKQGGRNLHQ
jgi:hypothetical protein